MNRIHRLTFLAAAVAVAALTVGTAAEAAVIGTAALVRNPPGAPFNTPEAALGAPWVGYTIGLATTAGELIGGVDVTITGQLHQRWVIGEDDFGNPANLPTPNSGNATAGDSHLRAVAGALFGSGPSEDNSLAGSPLANTASATYGIGSFLKGAWGIPNAQTTANVAYIVIPCGSVTVTDIRITVASPDGNIIGNLTSANFPSHEPPSELVVGDLGPLVGDMSLNPPQTPTIVSGTLPASDDQAGIANLSWMFDGPSTGPGAPLIAPTLDPATGLFTWDVNGSKGGLYTFPIKATNSDLCFSKSDSGLLTVEVVVPEPASVMLAGVALVALGCVNRRRSHSRNRRELPARAVRILAAALSLAVMLGTTAEAAVIGTATLVRQPPGVPFAAPDAALPAPWVGYSLGLQTTASELIAGIDVTIHGTLHQRWVFNEDFAMFDPTPNSANQSNGDSHLRAPAQIGFNGPSEDNSGNGSPLADTATSDYGVGSFLSGTWGVTNATTANLAYIVIPSGSEPLTDIRVLVGNSQGDIIGELTSRDFPGFMPPEFPPVVEDLTVRRSIGFPIPILTATLPVSDDSPLDELTWNLDSFTGPNPPLNPPTVDPATGLFTWNFNGAQLGGTYQAVIRATDTFGLSDTGTLTILPAPEPTCMTLLGLALIGLTGTFRHRLTLRR